MGETRLCLAALEVLSSSLAKEFSLGVLTNAMGGHQRLWHPKWWSRYVWGYFASMQIACFVSEQQYGIDRSKNPDQLWPWWNEIMQKKKRGEIPADMPGYMIAAYQNESEQRWAAAREAAAEAAHEE